MCDPQFRIVVVVLFGARNDRWRETLCWWLVAVVVTLLNLYVRASVMSALQQMRDQRKLWMAEASENRRMSHAHWTRHYARLRRKAGRRARRAMLRHGLWDPRYPLAVDPSASAFYYPTSSGVEDPTLLSSDDEANAPSETTKALARGVGTKGIREESSVADDASEFVMAEGPEVLLMTPKVVRTPVKSAAVYANAVAGALQLGPNVSFVGDAQNAAVQPVIDRFRVNSSAAPKRARAMSRAVGEGTPKPVRKPPTLTPAAPMSEVKSVVDSSYVRFTLPDTEWKAGTGLDWPSAADAAALMEARPAADESLMSTPMSPTRATVMTRPMSEIGAQTGFESNVHVDSLLPRRLAALQRRLAAVDAPALPPELGHLQRTGARAGNVCAHALRVASGAVHSDSDSDEGEVVAREVAAVEAKLGMSEPGTPRPFLLTNGLAALSTDPTLTSTEYPGDDSRDDSEVVTSGVGATGRVAPAAAARTNTARSESGPSLGRAELEAAAKLNFSPEIGDGTGYKGLGVGSVLVSRAGWTQQGMGLVAAAVPSQLLSDLDDNATWGTRPRGMLLAMCKPHTGPVTDLVTAQDHTFFVSGSSDATVAVWLTRNINKCVVAWLMG